MTSIRHYDEIIDIEVEPSRPYRYLAGQFVFLRARNADGRIEEHPFSFLSAPDERICLIGSGVGTVPVVSLLKELAAAGERRTVPAFLAVDTHDQILDRERLESIRRETAGLDVRFLVYDEDGIRFSEEFFRSEIPDPATYDYYICSSPRVRTIVTDALSKLGVAHRRVTFEAFSFS